MTKFVIYHTKKCQRMQGGKCYSCFLDTLENRDNYLALKNDLLCSWIGTTADVSEWGGLASDIFGNFDQKEVLEIVSKE